MSIKATKTETNFIIQPAGNHLGRIYEIIHIGTVDEEFEGRVMSRNKVRISFELPLETHEFVEGEGEKPFSISQEYTVSMSSKSKLRQHIEGMYGAGIPEEQLNEFEITDLIGRICMVNVAHKTSAKGNEYAYIAGLAPLPKGMEEPEAVNEPRILDFEDNWSEERFNALPDFIKDKIRESLEYKKLYNIQEEYIPDDVSPF